MFSTRKRLIAWLLGVLVIACVGAVAVESLQRYAAALKAVDETLAIERATSETLSLLKDAETAQRGFVLTGEPEFLATHSAAARALPAQIERLGALVAQHPEQEASVARLVDVADAKLAELAETIALRKQERTAEALSVVKEGRGQRLMTSARAEIASMLKREQKLLSRRQTAAQSGLSRLVATLVGSWLLLIVVLAGGVWSAARGLGEARRATAAVEDSERAMRALAENASDLVYVLGNDEELLYVSPSCERILGFTREEMLAMPTGELLPEQEREPIRLLGVQLRRGEVLSELYVHRLRNKEGRYLWFETGFRRVHDSELGTDHIHLTSRDITERLRFATELKESEERLREQRELALKEHADLLRVISVRDELTGLYNRRGFTEVGGQALRALARSKTAGCLFFVDLDGLKVINDTRGHETGDRAINAAAKVLTDVFRDSDVVARLGGDEFAILALECGLADIPSVLDRIAQCVADSNASDSDFVLSMSIGTALFEPPAAADFNALMDQADHAMYEQKRLLKQRRLA